MPRSAPEPRRNHRPEHSSAPVAIDAFTSAVHRLVHEEMERTIERIVAEQLRPLVAAVQALTARHGSAPLDADQYLTADEAAAIARVTPATVRQWVRDERLARYGTKSRLRVRRADLDSFLATAAIDATRVEAPAAVAQRVLCRAK